MPPDMSANHVYAIVGYDADKDIVQCLESPRPGIRPKRRRTACATVSPPATADLTSRSGNLSKSSAAPLSKPTSPPRKHDFPDNARHGHNQPRLTHRWNPPLFCTNAPHAGTERTRAVPASPSPNPPDSTSENLFEQPAQFNPFLPLFHPSKRAPLICQLPKKRFRVVSLSHRCSISHPFSRYLRAGI